MDASAAKWSGAAFRCIMNREDLRSASPQRSDAREIRLSSNSHTIRAFLVLTMVIALIVYALLGGYYVTWMLQTGKLWPGS